jgi:hypothetical protein
VTTVSGDVLRFDAQSNNPNDVLAAIPTPGGDAAPPTAGTCTADFINGSDSNQPVSPSKVRNQQDQKKNQVYAPLEEDVYVRITKSGSCAGLRLEFARAPSKDGTDREPVRLSFGDGSEAILSGNIPTERWEDGNRTLRLFDTDSGMFVGRTEIVEVQ